MKRGMNLTSLLVCAGLLLASQVHAATATLVLNTGVDANDVAMSAGSLDPNWSISTDGGSTFGAAKVAFPAQVCCGMETVDATAVWITDQSVTSDSSATAWGVNQVVILRRTFDLSGLDSGSAELHGVWRVADNTVGISLNGQEIVGAVNGFTFGADQALPADGEAGLFASGLNTLEIRGSSLNSTFDAAYFNGRVTALAPEPVPVPPTFWLFGPALGGLGFLRRRIA